MRAGAYTIHQSLTAEAAAVLKLALGLARRRGHAQVTPLHVAFTLLSSACSAAAGAAAYGLLKRACLRSHPATAMGSSPPAAHHPLQCRALELCFNVALNRLPTSAPHSPPPPSAAAASPAPFASSLIQPHPTLSNALVAALKRAQANQRRGCVELQQQPPPPAAAPQQQAAAQAQQQPLLAIKVELDQLIISILDDPSVSRVMREAGFSSATVKSNLEEESALMLSSSSSSPPPPSIPPHFFIDPSIGLSGVGGSTGVFGLWPAQFLSSSAMPVPSCKEDVTAVLEVMVRKHGRRTNPVVVGDTVSMAEAVAGELLLRLERGDVPEELAGAHLLKLQLSYVHVRLMSRADVDAKAAELRRSVDAVQRGGLVIYVGDLRWALDEEAAATDGDQTASSYSPVEHMVAELGRLLGDLRASAPPRGRVWLVATASYQTYMRCQQRRRRPSLEAAWALQVVVVPSSSGTGLALNNLHSSSSPSNPTAAAPVQQQQEAMATKQQPAQGFFTAAGEPMAFAAGCEQEDKLILCTECGRNYEREAEAGGVGLPGWLVPAPDKPPAADQVGPPHEKYLVDLKRKWSRLCRKLHLCGGHTDHPCSAPCFGAVLGASPTIPWWSSSCLYPSSQGKPSIAGFLGLEGLVEQAGHGKFGSQWSPPRQGLSSPTVEPGCRGMGTALALGSLPHSDSATSDNRALGTGGSASARELERRLRKNVPWQPAAMTRIVEAVAGGGGDGYRRKGVWLFFKGSDHAAQRRAVTVIAETHCGSGDRIVSANPKLSGAEDLCADVVSRARKIGGGKFVLIVGDTDRAAEEVVECLVAAFKCGSFKDRFGQELDLSDSIVILTTSELADGVSNVISLRLSTSEESSSGELKRKTDMGTPPRGEPKRPRRDAGCVLDLNLSLPADDDGDEEAIPSDITHEGGSSSGDHGDGAHSRLLASVAADVVTFDKNHRAAISAIRSVLAGAVDDGKVRVDDEAAETLTAASGGFLEETLERWVAEVFAPAARVRSGGKTLALAVRPAGGGAQEPGFMGSVLPSRVHVD